MIACIQNPVLVPSRQSGPQHQSQRKDGMTVQSISSPSRAHVANPADMAVIRRLASVAAFCAAMLLAPPLITAAVASIAGHSVPAVVVIPNGEVSLPTPLEALCFGAVVFLLLRLYRLKPAVAATCSAATVCTFVLCCVAYVHVMAYAWADR